MLFDRRGVNVKTVLSRVAVYRVCRFQRSTFYVEPFSGSVPIGFQSRGINMGLSAAWRLIPKRFNDARGVPVAKLVARFCIPNQTVFLTVLAVSSVYRNKKGSAKLAFNCPFVLLAFPHKRIKRAVFLSALRNRQRLGGFEFVKISKPRVRLF